MEIVNRKEIRSIWADFFEGKALHCLCSVMGCAKL